MRIFLILLLWLPHLSNAGEYSYSCKVKGELLSTDAGLITSGNEIYLDSKFSVERKSGVVLGEDIGNSSYPTKQVIDMGSSDQSYKLIWISREVIGFEGDYNSVYLNVEEHNPNLLKPVTLNLGSRTLSGVCN
jgi:hypothetical protein